MYWITSDGSRRPFLRVFCLDNGQKIRLQQAEYLREYRELLQSYDDSALPLTLLHEHGLKGNIRAARRVEDVMVEIIDHVVG